MPKDTDAIRGAAREALAEEGRELLKEADVAAREAAMAEGIKTLAGAPAHVTRSFIAFPPVIPDGCSRQMRRRIERKHAKEVAKLKEQYES